MNLQLWLSNVLWLAFLITNPLLGQESLSLNDAINWTLKNSFQIRIAEENLNISKNNNDWSIAGKYPNINAVLGLNNGYTNNNNPASFLTQLSSVSTGLTPSLEANWTLFNGYRVHYVKEQLENQELLSEGNLQLAVEAAIQTTINAYYAALIQKEQLQVLQEVLTLSRDRIKYQEVRKEFGQAVTFDLLQTQDAYFNDSINYLSQKINYENGIRNLKQAMGIDDHQLSFVLTDKLEMNSEAFNIEALQSSLLTSNKNLQTLFVNRELANINTKIESTAMKPTVSVRGGVTYNYNLASGSGTLSNGENISLDAVTQKTLNGFINFTASYNLFDAGVRQRRIQNAQKQELVAQFNIDNLKRSLNTQLGNTWAVYNNQKELVQLSSQLLSNAAQNLKIAEERFKSGLINSFDYRSIQLSYINASQSKLSAIYNLKVTETELLKLTGGLIR